MPEVLLIENVHVSHSGRRIVAGGVLHAREGTITGLLGKNGSGKSTLLKTAYGIRQADECDVSVNGIKKRKPYQIAGLLNYLPQQPFLPANMKVGDLLRYFKVPLVKIRDHFPELEQDYWKRIDELSGGTERLSSVLILVMAPTRFTLLDEPFTHLMPLHKECVKKLLSEYKASKGFIVTDHLYQDLLDIADDMYFMKDGSSFLLKNRNDLVLHDYIRTLE